VAAVLVVLLVGAIGCDGGGLPVKQIARVFNERIPNGSSPERVIAVLDSLGVEHGSYDPRDQTVQAIVRESPRRSFTFVTGSMRTRFVFGSDRRLTDREIRVVYTGP
jgi:hypothetical protein